MLRWTPAGAVSAPTTVQMRLTRRYPDRLKAGAPQPARCLSPAELRSNILHFSEGMRGPRSRPCTSLVLSGLGLGHRVDLPDALDLARAHGMSRIVVHAGATDLLPSEATPAPATLPLWRERIDVLVLPSPRAARADALRSALQARVAPRTVSTVDLGAIPEHELPTVVDALCAGRPDEVVWTIPFPPATAESAGSGGPPPAPPRPPDLPAVHRALLAALPRLQAAGVPCSLKGLPRCIGPGLDIARRRTGNRWYVDADHQADEALLFLPEVLRFHKGDGCRFCVEDADCDGYFGAYLADASGPRLVPIDAGPGSSD